jgi:hypothetical protein
MKRSQLEEIIEEELYKYFAEQTVLDEKSVPEPYDRKNRRRMSDSQIDARDSIGKKIKKNKKAVAKFKKKYGSDWESYLWASATSKAIKGGE